MIGTVLVEQADDVALTDTEPREYSRRPVDLGIELRPRPLHA